MVVSCNLFLYLCNILADMVMLVTLVGFQGGIHMGARLLTNLRYADGIIMLASLFAMNSHVKYSIRKKLSTL